MRISRPVAWIVVLLVLFTSGLLRQFHDQTPRSPYIPMVVGSLLFAGVFFLLLVSAREWRIGAAPGRGIRIGSLTPLLLMLLIEKWVSLSLYNPVFYAFSPAGAPDDLLDAMYRAFAGAGLLLVCFLIGWFSRPAARATARRASVRKWPGAAIAVGLIVVLTYVLLGGLARSLGGNLSLAWPTMDETWGWTIGGQALLSFAEELYYRGLILAELHRLAPRLGIRRAGPRRWFALLASAIVFGMEHLAVGAAGADLLRQLTFTVSLGLLFGMLVLITDNLHFAAGVHTWINWLLLGAAPWFIDAAGRPALPSGTYIGIVLILAFCLAAVLARIARGRASPGASAGLS